MKSLEKKNTRIFYRDKENMDNYRSLPAEEFKELFIKLLEYNVGDEVKPSDFSSPLLFPTFNTYRQKIDVNETEWDKRKETSKENGKKGGRPKKEKNEEFVTETVKQQIKPNTNFDKGDVEENSLQLFLGFLSERKPQKNQTLNTMLNLNSSISGFCDTNRINQATREKAWEIYTKGV